MYITGIGRTKFGVLNKGLAELTYEAMFATVKDWGGSINDIDAIFVSNFVGGQFQSQLHINSLVSSLLPDMNIPILRVETACAAGGSALYIALKTLSSFENVMVLGVEKMNSSENASSTSNIAMAGDRTLDQEEGLIFPAGYALCAQQHMLRYGTTTDDLALVSLKNHRNANLNEYAHFYNKVVELDEIKKSQIVSTPLRLFDCSPVSDGAAALVLSKKKHSDRDVEVSASSMATEYISLSQRRDLTSFPAAKIAAREAYHKANKTPKEVDIAEIHDCFTIAELIGIEDLGLCKPGESKELIREGKTARDGDIPVNTDGGLKANGHPIGATGIAQVYEVVKQLRGDASKRQVENAEVGLTHNIGGYGGTAVIHILERV
jgi:acetyl-CoA C-acetyltransferase